MLHKKTDIVYPKIPQSGRRVAGGIGGICLAGLSAVAGPAVRHGREMQKRCAARGMARPAHLTLL
ncbi:hypothetical protein CNY67_15245 [Desulfovibrio sp. G11]|uniref:Uncharacterized protein n=1 Tax=Desulfovibrio falkowii TaxID=3136602 RepID=A0ABQ0ECG3_9BACT|nr:hypothetical protein CNY67_15245 [Desulfovibrio sp. G11]